jgi:hypothetical protein
MINELTFGVEIECIMPSHMYAEILSNNLREHGIDCFTSIYNHAISTSWKLVADGSLTGNGIELVSPILKGEEGFREIRKICKALTSLEITVNKSCGFHVHVGVNNESVEFFKNLYMMYHMFEGTIDTIMPISRRANTSQYCRSLKDIELKTIAEVATLRDIAKLTNNNRYSKLNFQAFWRQGTIEFRHHSGTVNSSKIVSWILICLNMVKTAKKGLPENMKPKAKITTKVQQRNFYNPARRNSVARKVIDVIVNNDYGYTQQEMVNYIGFDTWGSIGALLRRFNVPFTTTQEGHHKRFKFVRSSNTVEEKEYTFEVVNTDLNAFVDVLELSPLEAAFMHDRTMELANA